MLGYAKYVLTYLSSVQWLVLGGLLLLIFFVQWCYRLVLYDERKTRKRTWTVTNCCTLIFLASIFWSTLFLRTPGTEHQANLIPLWSWHQSFIQHNDEMRWQIYFNVLLFVPFGFCIFFSGLRSLRRVLRTGFLLSLFIEVCQYIFCLGLFEWDDLIHNSLGCLLGGFTAKIIERVWNINRLHKTSGRK